MGANSAPPIAKQKQAAKAEFSATNLSRFCAGSPESGVNSSEDTHTKPQRPEVWSLMDAQMIAILIAGGTALSVVVWMLAKVGQAPIKIAEAGCRRGGVLCLVAGDQSSDMGLAPDGHLLADQADRGRSAGLVPLVGLGIVGQHCRTARGGAHRVATGQPEVVRCVGGPASARLVAALDGVLSQARLALLTTQGRALGFTVRGYVQESTKDTVPVRELCPRRIRLRVAAKSHVGMVLGDQAYERGAWANRITDSEAGVGYVFGKGIREPLRVRAGWVPDQTIKAVEAFVTAPCARESAALALSTTGSTPGGPA
jgi:hypothetical protein